MRFSVDVLATTNNNNSDLFVVVDGGRETTNALPYRFRLLKIVSVVLISSQLVDDVRNNNDLRWQKWTTRPSKKAQETQ